MATTAKNNEVVPHNTETGEVTSTDLQEMADKLTQNTVDRTLDSLSGRKANVVSSFTGTDHGTLIKVAQAVGNAEPIRDHLGETFNLTNYVAQATEVESLANPGTMDQVVRIVLVDDEGQAWAGISVGIAKSIENLVGIVGQPSQWPAPVPIKVVSKQGKRGSYHTIQYV
jgi:hypothetical protein